MKRLAFVAWCVGSAALWSALVFAACHFVLSRVWYLIPIGFYEAVNNGLLWTVRRFKPEYDPGVLQMDDPGLFLLLGLVCLICAAVVIPVSAYGWQRFNSWQVERRAE